MALEPDTGCVWVVFQEFIYRLDREGRLIGKIKTAAKTQKSIAVIP
jgi:hypothetical protein